jgi:anti-sigma factor RsiW
MTELSDELLVAYVDGQLARQQSSAVDRVLEQTTSSPGASMR